MLHIILLILKIIGILLLSILGILLLIIACVMFVPVRYRIRVTREEGTDKPPAVVYVKITWLLHLFNILVRYPYKIAVRVRILLFTIFRIPEKQKKRNKQKVKDIDREKMNDSGHVEEDQRRTKEDSEKESTIPEGQDITDNSKKTDNTENTENIQETRTLPEYKQLREDDSSTDSQETEHTNRKGKIQDFIDKIRQIINKIKGFFKNIQYTIRKFCDKIKAVSDNIKYYREVLESDPFRQSLQLCKGELGWVFKKLKPDKFEADFIVGMEDPATTGEILAIYGMLYPLIGQNVRIVGDFGCEKLHLEGQLYIRGKIRAFTFLRTALRIYFNKDLKKLIKLLKKEAV